MTPRYTPQEQAARDKVARAMWHLRRMARYCRENYGKK